MGEDLSEWRLGGGGLVTWVGMKHEWEVKKQPEGAVTPQTAPFRGCGVGNDCVGLQGQRMDFYFERREEVSIFIQMNMWIRSFSWIVLSSFCPLDFPSNLASLRMSLQFSFILRKKKKNVLTPFCFSFCISSLFHSASHHILSILHSTCPTIDAQEIFTVWLK